MSIKGRIITLLVKRKIEGSETMSKILNWLRGKKTYLTALMIGIAAGLKSLGVEVPDYIFELLAGLGLINLRAGVAKSEKSKQV